jgi:hypothetical protein
VFVLVFVLTEVVDVRVEICKTAENIFKSGFPDEILKKTAKSDKWG